MAGRCASAAPAGGRKTRNPAWNGTNGRPAWPTATSKRARRPEGAACSREGRGELAGRTAGTGSAVALGSPAARTGRAVSDVLVVADGAPWIWNVATDRWAGRTELLDFYHASQHLWALGRALHRGEDGRRRAWVEPRLHRLRHGKATAVLRELAALRPPRGAAGASGAARTELLCQATPARMNYHALAQRGWPIGSGAVESACRQRNVASNAPVNLDRNRIAASQRADRSPHNHHWDELWSPN